MNDIYTTNSAATNFVSVRQLTEDEARKIYMKMTKAKLVEMLIACNKAMDALYEQMGGAEKTIIYPSAPNDDWNLACTDWLHCRNPQKDCINCPLRAVYCADKTDFTYTTKVQSE